MIGASLNRHNSRQDYETPSELVAAVELDIIRDRFVWDLASDGVNNKAPHYLTEREDALLLDWSALNEGPGTGPVTSDAWCWLNPPFRNISKWAEKCHHHAETGVRVCLLLPASVGSNWFAEHVWGVAHVFAIRPRVTFVGASDPYPKDLILAVYGYPPGFSLWKWRRL